MQNSKLPIILASVLPVAYGAFKAYKHKDVCKDKIKQKLNYLSYKKDQLSLTEFQQNEINQILKENKRSTQKAIREVLDPAQKEVFDKIMY